MKLRAVQNQMFRYQFENFCVLSKQSILHLFLHIFLMSKYQYQIFLFLENSMGCCRCLNFLKIREVMFLYFKNAIFFKDPCSGQQYMNTLINLS